MLCIDTRPGPFHPDVGLVYSNWTGCSGGTVVVPVTEIEVELITGIKWQLENNTNDLYIY